MIKVQIYYHTYSWEDDSPEEVLSLIKFQKKFNNGEFNDVRFIKFIVE